jgi:hypothetical protein
MKMTVMRALRTSTLTRAMRMNLTLISAQLSIRRKQACRLMTVWSLYLLISHLSCRYFLHSRHHSRLWGGRFWGWLLWGSFNTIATIRCQCMWLIYLTPSFSVTFETPPVMSISPLLSDAMTSLSYTLAPQSCRPLSNSNSGNLQSRSPTNSYRVENRTTDTQSSEQGTAHATDGRGPHTIEHVLV